MSLERRLSLVALLFITAFAPARAAIVPTGYTDAVFASGIASPTTMAFAPDGRLFVLSQTGAVRIVKAGALLSTPFLTLTVDSAGERGLIGIAFHPAFASNGWVYLYYTVPGSPARNRVSRFTANGDVAVPSSETIILELDPLSGATNHNGGALHFGADGFLYVAVGDNANGTNAPNLATLHGKLLRIAADGSAAPGNPFSGTARAPFIWARGLRNPYTFAFEPGTSGRLYINDVGQSTWEEINRGVIGADYGWPATEGPTSASGVTAPIFAYQHSGAAPTGCAITGGSFWLGEYYFADFCSRWIYRLSNTTTPTATLFASGLSGNPVDVVTGLDGRLYYLMRNGVVGVVTAPAALTSTTVPLPYWSLIALALLLMLGVPWTRGMRSQG